MDLITTITESLARFHKFTAPADKLNWFDYSASSHSPLLGRDNFCHLGTESLRYQSHLNKGRKCTTSPHTGASTRSWSRPGHCWPCTFNAWFRWSDWKVYWDFGHDKRPARHLLNMAQHMKLMKSPFMTIWQLIPNLPLPELSFDTRLDSYYLNTTSLTW